MSHFPTGLGGRRLPGRLLLPGQFHRTQVLRTQLPLLRLARLLVALDRRQLLHVGVFADLGETLLLLVVLHDRRGSKAR